jgi:hypothetical protein
MTPASGRDMRKLFLSIAVLFAVSEALGGAVVVADTSQVQTGPIKIVRSSDYLEKVATKLKQPGLTVEQAADYANSLLAIHGFDYHFDACPVVKANPHPQSIEDQYGLAKIYNYSFVQTNGRRIKMQLIGDPTSALCGECAFYIPLLRATKRQLLVVSDGKQYSLRRPPGFFLKEISLLDRSMKKTVRTWEVPLDTELAGISEDGTRIYVELYNNYNSEDLINKMVIEVSRSTMRFQARSQVAARDGEFVMNQQTDRVDSYLAFKRFRVGNKQYIIRYDLPCT